MRLRLQTKITLLISLLVLAVVGVSSWLYVAALTSDVIHEADNRAGLASKLTFLQAQDALAQAATEGRKPASNGPADLSAYIQQALENNAALTTLINAEVGYSFLVYEVTIVDRDGAALISSDPALSGLAVPPRPPLSRLVDAGFLRQLRIIFGPPQAYSVSYSFMLGPPGQQVPFGEVRVAVQTGLLRSEITPALRSAGLLALASLLVSVLLAAIVSSLLLRPVERISAQLDRISRGEFDETPLETPDEFGQVSTKISQIGLQLRGVRQIFSSYRENLDQVLGGLQDGLLLFTPEGRAVMVSPAVAHFLGAPADQLLGRMAEEIFPPDSPFHDALRLSGNEFEPVAAAEVAIDGLPMGAPQRRTEVSVQVINEHGTRMGALVTLRDPKALEGISRQLQVSEGLASVGRVTRGVAHEVKNPLNSMSIWLENLKEVLPPDDELPRQAVAILDSEIHRLDSVVKRFLDFANVPELHWEEASLEDLLNEIAGIAKPQMERAGVRLEKKFDAVPPVRVDLALLKQALQNLVFNAIQAMPLGGTLTLSLRPLADMAEISIADTGSGIAPEHRAQIFQLFFTTRPGGSGIGLATAYKAVHLQDGAIDFESEVGRGTTFRIALPLARPLERPLAVPDATPVAGDRT